MQRLSSTPSRTEQVYRVIRDSICDCTLKPDTHLVQEELAENLGVSRQPVQQAMLLLKNDGLVVERGGRGLYVAPLEPEAIIHHYQIRIVMDRLAARLVSERAKKSKGFQSELRDKGAEILTAGDAAWREGDATHAVQEDVRFHTFVYEMSGNPMIASTALPHWNFLRRVMVAILIHANRGELVWQEHHAILEALASGNAAKSEALMESHATGAQNALVAKIEQDQLCSTMSP